MIPENEFQPIFLNAIKRNGYYFMSYETYDLYSSSCVRHYSGRKNFQEWMDDKKLKATKSDLRKQVKIEKV